MFVGKDVLVFSCLSLYRHASAYTYRETDRQTHTRENGLTKMSVPLHPSSKDRKYITYCTEEVPSLEVVWAIDQRGTSRQRDSSGCTATPVQISRVDKAKIDTRHLERLRKQMPYRRKNPS
ncbi:hypothetical protein F5B22DRAFT_630273 [Xylaria bambusicola]|uniref:uncharacterized protein n=1 Tax=Xylaria bambusicola TaxID=326684 RepID=UPI002008AA9E|nr:uncharacterized protein F5B22DRAFT_630273 [Xylaria bambusicola]KAI0503187.1 hypothetical protein F5B22DRAFT_630273 [Xylaria bambusicola]